MKKDRRVIMSIIWIIIGSVLIGLSFAGKIDLFWSNMGSALFVIGIIQVLRFRRFRKNEAYREKIEIETNDERNQFIRNKAWAWAGYLFILIAGVSVIVLRILGEELISIVISYAVCFMLMLYWISYLVLQKKY